LLQERSGHRSLTGNCDPTEQDPAKSGEELGGKNSSVQFASVQYWQFTAIVRFRFSIVRPLDSVGLPVLARAEQTVESLRVRRRLDLRDEIQVVTSVPTLDVDTIGCDRYNVTVEVDVQLPALDLAEQDFHAINPLVDLARFRLPPVRRMDFASGSIGPGFVENDSLGERERLATGAANEQPAATALRAVQLAWRRDEGVGPGALAVAHEVVDRFSQVLMPRHHSPPRPIQSQDSNLTDTLKTSDSKSGGYADPWLQWYTRLWSPTASTQRPAFPVHFASVTLPLG
jgi:hypothetical protein